MRSTRVIVSVLITILVLVGTELPRGNALSAQEGKGDPPPPSFLPHQPGFFHPLPFNVTNAFRSDPEFTQWPWECDDDYRHDTGPAPDNFRYPGEFELTNGVLFGWSEYNFGCLMEDQRELIRASLGTTAEVTVLIEQSLISSAIRCLRSHGFTEEQIDRINFVAMKMDSPWIRDFGPDFLTDASDGFTRAVVDPTYFGVVPRPDNCRPLERGALLEFGRSNADASPTRLANLIAEGKAELRGVGAIDAYRMPLVFEGGNIFTDGAGTCFRNRLDTNVTNSDINTHLHHGLPWLEGGWSYTEEQVDALIADYYRCDRVVALDSIRPTSGEAPGGVIDHIDMTLTFLSPDTVLVGDYSYQAPDGSYLTRSGTSEADDPFNDDILDGRAARLEELGYHVVRIPMPAPFCVRDRSANCQPDYARDLTSDTIIDCPAHVYDESKRFVGGIDEETGKPIFRTWATYANSIRIGEAMMVPSYHESSLALAQPLRDLIQAQEAEALRVYQAELDRLYGEGAVLVVPVQSDGLAPCNGSLQCITKTY